MGVEDRAWKTLEALARSATKKGTLRERAKGAFNAAAEQMFGGSEEGEKAGDFSQQPKKKAQSVKRRKRGASTRGRPEPSKGAPAASPSAVADATRAAEWKDGQAADSWAPPPASDVEGEVHPLHPPPAGSEPPAYGVDRLVLIVRPSGRAFAYWENPPGRFSEPQGVLRFVNETSGQVSARPVELSQGRQWFDLEPGHAYHVELIGADGQLLSCSAPITAQSSQAKLQQG